MVEAPPLRQKSYQTNASWSFMIARPAKRANNANFGGAMDRLDMPNRVGALADAGISPGLGRRRFPR